MTGSEKKAIGHESAGQARGEGMSKYCICVA